MQFLGNRISNPAESVPWKDHAFQIFMILRDKCVPLETASQCIDVPALIELREDASDLKRVVRVATCRANHVSFPCTDTCPFIATWRVIPCIVDFQAIDAS